MLQIKTELHHDAIEKIPELAIAGFLVKDIDIAAQNAINDQHGEHPISELTLETLASYPPIAAWRTAFVTMRLKPSTFKSSIEQLLRRSLKGERVKTPLAIVNAYCDVSTLWAAPMGGYDIESLPETTIAIRCARPGRDSFSPLAGRASDMKLTESVVVYASGSEILCWALNHRDSKVTCLTQRTSTAAFFSESVSFSQQAAMYAALDDMRTKLKAWGATVGNIVTVSSSSPVGVLAVA